jgi:outer membrane lipoprotein-sorting protein
MLLRMNYTGNRVITTLFAVCAAFWFAVGSAIGSTVAGPEVLQEARAALELLAQKHRSAAAVSLAFESRALGADGNPMPVAKGTLLTADSGRFRLTHAQGTVVCDGVTLWQHYPSTRQVLIRPAGEGGAAGGVLLRFLQARAVKAQRLGGTDGALRIALDPGSVGESLDSLVITLSPDAATIRRVDTQDPAGNRVEYTVTSLRYDARPGSGAFTFKIPSGTEVVDMR